MNNNNLDNIDNIEINKVRKPLPKVMKLNNKGWQLTAGIAGSHDCSAGCQQTMFNTCRC